MKSMIATAVSVAAVIGTVLAHPGGALAQTASTTTPLGWVDLQRVTTESDEGKLANARLQELREQKRSEIEARNTQAQGEIGSLNQKLADAQQQVQQGQNVLSAEAVTKLQREISRLQVDVQRKTQDAQADLTRMQEDAELEVQALSRELQGNLEAVLLPAIVQLSSDKGIAMILRVESLAWADPALDLTQDLIDLLDSQAAEPQ